MKLIFSPPLLLLIILAISGVTKKVILTNLHLSNLVDLNPAAPVKANVWAGLNTTKLQPSKMLLINSVLSRRIMTPGPIMSQS